MGYSFARKPLGTSPQALHSPRIAEQSALDGDKIWPPQLEVVVRSLQHWTGRVHDLAPTSPLHGIITKALERLDADIQRLDEALARYSGHHGTSDVLIFNIVQMRIESVIEAATAFNDLMEHTSRSAPKKRSKS